ncbi:MAG: hypothetical protein WA087_03315 [Candidatus Saccharimonadales bacterium]
MATKKSKIVKKSKVVKKTAPKKVVKRVAAFKTVRRAKTRAVKSFAVASERQPFVAFKVTDQTIYWSILLGYILLLSLWILKIQIDTQTIIDKISISL